MNQRTAALAVLIALLTLPASTAWSQTSQAGSILTIGPGAQAGAMAESFAALATGTFGSAYNPAGLARAQGVAFGFQHQEWAQDIRLDYLTVMLPLGPGHMQGAVQLVNYGLLDVYTETGLRTGDTFSPYDLSLHGAYGLKLAPEWNVGGGFTLNQTLIRDYRDTGLAAHLGVLWQAPWPGFTAAAVFKNLGGAASGYAFPMRGVLAAGYTGLEENTLSANLELDLPLGLGGVEAAVGVEYRLVQVLSLRLGYRLGAQGHDDPLFGLSTGLGVAWRNLDFSYALRPLGDFGFSHQVSLSYTVSSLAEPSGVETGAASASVKPEVREAVEKRFLAGKYYYRKKNYKKAIAEWELIREFNPDHQKSKIFLERARKEMEAERQRLYQLAEEANSRGEFKREILYWQEVLKLDPDDPRAKENVWMEIKDSQEENGD